MSPDEIQSTLERALPGSTVRVDDLTGNGDHFQIWIISQSFEGKSLMDQHQMIYKILRDALGSERIHTLTLKTYTPAQ